MSDVAVAAGSSFCAGFPSSSSGGSLPLPPGLPLPDPLRVTGAYGVPAYDPDFGFALRGSAFDHQIPAPAPPPPPLVSNAVGRDPYAQLLESQSATSILMMQMAREMHQRNAQQLQQQPPQQPVHQDANPLNATQQGLGQQGLAPREMKMHEKWIPSMLVPQRKQWNTGGKVIWIQKMA